MTKGGLETTAGGGVSHTEGPWGYFQDDDYGEEFVVDVVAQRKAWPQSRPYLYTKVATVESGNPERAEANARLIAAAPELLQALMDARKVFLEEGLGRFDRWPSTLGVIEDAIARAVVTEGPDAES